MPDVGHLLGLEAFNLDRILTMHSNFLEVLVATRMCNLFISSIKSCLFSDVHDSA